MKSERKLGNLILGMGSPVDITDQDGNVLRVEVVSPRNSKQIKVAFVSEPHAFKITRRPDEEARIPQ